jgi:hypothetical protein
MKPKTDRKKNIRRVMNQITFYFMFFVWISSPLLLNAQAIITDPLAIKNKISISAGLFGTSLGYTRRINDKLSARLYFNFFNENFDFDNKFDFGGQQGEINLDFKNNTINLDIEYLLFKNTKSLKLIVGLDYLNKLQLKSTTIPSENRNYGAIVLTPSDLGIFKTKIKWLGVRPYLGMGYETNLFKNITFGVELGATYLPKPTIKFESTGILTPMSDLEQEDFRNWINQFYLLPNLKISLAHRFDDSVFKFSKKNNSKNQNYEIKN